MGLGRSQNDIVVNDVEADIVSGGGLGDQHVGFEESVATEPGVPQNLTADQMFALNLLKASDVQPEKVTQQVLKMCNVVRER